MHESTISRVTTNKYVYTPQGVFNLKFFFNSAINMSLGDQIASESVKEKIRQLVAGENPENPLSDQEIADNLRRQDVTHCPAHRGQISRHAGGATLQ